jgi:hypothetical protein
MSCSIHDRCTCYAAFPNYTASLATTTASSQLVPQTNNILVGYEWAAPLVPNSTPWYPFESVLIQPPTSGSGQEISGTVPVHNSYHPEPRVYEREQKPAPPSREQVRFPSLHSVPGLPKASLQLNTHIIHITSRVLPECPCRQTITPKC